mmetsp:Transcript_44699/g.93582  ORF Transcript_44699/g.93582 Transcript_44699/m.93582 type:complete len:258 (+) Transcript_44699:386-1159(+)
MQCCLYMQTNRTCRPPCARPRSARACASTPSGNGAASSRYARRPSWASRRGWSGCASRWPSARHRASIRSTLQHPTPSPAPPPRPRATARTLCRRARRGRGRAPLGSRARKRRSPRGRRSSESTGAGSSPAAGGGDGAIVTRDAGGATRTRRSARSRAIASPRKPRPFGGPRREPPPGGTRFGRTRTRTPTRARRPGQARPGQARLGVRVTGVGSVGRSGQLTAGGGRPELGPLPARDESLRVAGPGRRDAPAAAGP